MSFFADWLTVLAIGCLAVMTPSYWIERITGVVLIALELRLAVSQQNTQRLKL